MKLIVLSACCALFVASGCAVRSAEMYRDDTRRLLETKHAVLEACYDAELQTHPTTTGKVVVRFAVESGTGKIKSPQVDDLASTPSRTLRGCVLDALQALTLQPADDRAGDATYTWEFQLPHT